MSIYSVCQFSKGFVVVLCGDCETITGRLGATRYIRSTSSMQYISSQLVCLQYIFYREMYHGGVQLCVVASTGYLVDTPPYYSRYSVG